MTKSRDDLLKTVHAVIVQHFKNHGDGSPGAITGATRLVDDLRLDSLDVVELTLDLEDQIDRELDEIRMAKLATIDDLLDYLSEPATTPA